MTANVALPRLEAAPAGSIPISRLIRVELRKQIDTRAGRWVLIVLGLALVAMATTLVFVDGGAHRFQDIVVFLTVPLLLGIPIIGVLAATTEWSQRTVLTTFTLEPRRGRVVAGKTIAALVTGLLATLVAVACSALAHGVAVVFRDAEPSWGLDGRVILGLAVVTVLSLVQGVAFGLALMSTPLALVGLFILPTVWSVAGGLIPGFARWLPWLDMSAAMEPLFAETTSMGGTAWAHLASASMLWVLVPLLIGLIRVQRSEVS